MTADIVPGSAAWHALVREDIVEPDLPIIDPHHHLWDNPVLGRYLVPELKADTGSGHNVVKTVYMECGSFYRQDGPERLKPLGETEFVVAQARESEATEGARIAAMVGRADLRLGDAVAEVLEAHVEVGEGLFRGIRHAGARLENREGYSIFAGRSPAGLYEMDAFRDGMRVLGRMGLTYDTWQYHFQMTDFIELARAVPDTLMVLDHFSTPLGAGEYAGRQDEIFESWQADIRELSRCDNVVLKLGGLAMPDNGFGWDTSDVPPSSDELAEAHRRYYLHAIECFGVARCMMESNFPVDAMSVSYHVLFNGMKKIVADFSAGEKAALFHDTAARIYSV